MILKFIFATLTRLSFIILSLIAVWRVKHVKDNNIFWFLSFLCLPLVVEMIITLKRRKGQDYKWFSPAILLFLIAIIPSIWILELHHHQNKKPDHQCAKLDSWANIIKMISLNETTPSHILKRADDLLSSVCPDDWILGLHQALLILLILGKWVLPLGGGVTRDELSQLLLIFVGLAADILEFTNETLSDVNEKSPKLVYIILAVWTWSMLQFPLHLAVVTSRQEGSPKAGSDSLLSRRSTDMWSIVESLFIQDGPFLVVRLTVLMHYKIFHQMLVFFAIKNFLVVILNLYWLCVICQDSRKTQKHNTSIPCNTEEV
ncbi:transmembrane protein 26-like [Anguilla anguilla]|uniref:transmembrane protein 26-like n=1 Tax=Anguilla anguilla TaxID=7936 RepID=UPI0015B029F9|nr:transmembrane protein 26-like [Anguilla anguilla]